MAVDYFFKIDDIELHYHISIDREFDFKENRDHLPQWTQLNHQQCSNCPLTTKDCSHCPAAVDLSDVVSDFQRLPAIQEADIRVVTPEREYVKHATLEEGVRSLMGLIMATSACPILAQLKPNARYHLPFASQDEFIARSTAMYLLGEYFRYREGKHPDWELQGMIQLNQELQILNQAFWQRIHDACESDSNLKALLSFFNLSSSVSYSLEAQLQKIRPLIVDENQTPAIKSQLQQGNFF